MVGVYYKKLDRSIVVFQTKDRSWYDMWYTGHDECTKYSGYKTRLETYNKIAGDVFEW